MNTKPTELRRPVIFLDDGGVISDSRVRRPQWQRLVVEFFAPRLGGAPDAWAAANGALVDRLFVPEVWQARLTAARDYADFERVYWWDWLQGMCELVGVPTPPQEEAIALAAQAGRWIPSQIHSGFPGAAEAIRALHAAGYTLHTASGESSSDLDGYLSAMGVRACFGRLYGPDLINTLKNGPAFYARLLADAGVAPHDALVVDDRPEMLAWALEVGTYTALVSADPPPHPATLHLQSLAELPARLAQWDHHL